VSGLRYPETSRPAYQAVVTFGVPVAQAADDRDSPWFRETHVEGALADTVTGAGWVEQQTPRAQA
jgi:hypothetical protein